MKLFPKEGEVYVLAESKDQSNKERGIRIRKFTAYWKRLGELRDQGLTRDVLLKKLGGAQERAGRVAVGLVDVEVGKDGGLVFKLNRNKLRVARRREGRYLLRTNLTVDDPELIWRCYMQLCQVEEAFRTMRGDLGLRPIFHQKAERIEAHLFVAFLAYCLSITLRQVLRSVAPGLMPRAVLETFATLQLLDVSVPTIDGHELRMVRRTEPDRDLALLLARLGCTLPPQPPPKITLPAPTQM